MWRDANGDGVSQASELTSLASAGVASIDLCVASSGDGVEGNTISHRGKFTWSDGSTGESAAVQFATDQIQTHYQLPEGFQYDPDVFALPNLKGYGRVPDLWVAMSIDPELKAMVQDLVAGAANDNAELACAA